MCPGSDREPVAFLSEPGFERASELQDDGVGSAPATGQRQGESGLILKRAASLRASASASELAASAVCPFSRRPRSTSSSFTGLGTRLRPSAQASVREMAKARRRRN